MTTAFKNYLAHLSALNDFSNTTKELLIFIYSERGNYDTFNWTSRKAMEAALSIGTTVENIKKSMPQLLKKGMISRIDRGVYQYELPALHKSNSFRVGYRFSNSKTIETYE